MKVYRRRYFFNWILTAALFFSVCAGCEQQQDLDHDKPEAAAVGSEPAVANQEHQSAETTHRGLDPVSNVFETRYFAIEVPPGWIVEEDADLTGSDGLSVKSPNEDPNLFSTNVSFQSVYVGDTQGFTEWEKDDVDVETIDSRRFQVASKSASSKLGPIVHESFAHTDVSKKRMFAAVISCGAQNHDELLVAKNLVRSIKIRFPSVSQSPDALKPFLKGWTLNHGLNQNVDQAAAKEYYRQASRLGSPLADMAISVQETLDEAVRLTARDEQQRRCRKLINITTELADSGNRESQTILGMCYFHGLGIEPDWFISEHWLQRASVNGCPVAKGHLAMLFMEKDDPTSHATAIELLQNSLQMGYPRAGLSLAEAYDSGKGVNRNLTRCFELTNNAAQRGVEHAVVNMGVYCRTGHGTQVSPRKAFQWNLHGAKMGIVMSINGVAFNIMNRKQMSLNITKEEISTHLTEIEEKIRGNDSVEFAYAHIMVGLADESQDEIEFKDYIDRAKKVLSKHARNKSPDAWYELMNLYGTVYERTPDAIDGETHYCRMRAGELGHALAARQWLEIEQNANKNNRAHLASVRWEKAALREEESVGGFVAPEWAYEPTPSLEEYRAKFSSNFTDDDVLSINCAAKDAND